MRGNWSVESTIGLLFTIIIAILALAIVSAIGLAAYAAMDTGPSQRIVQQVETNGRCSPPVHRGSNRRARRCHVMRFD